MSFCPYVFMSKKVFMSENMYLCPWVLSENHLILQPTTDDVLIMAAKSEKNLKLYYSIKEVAEMFDVKESLLRYWETEFPHLRPKTTGNKVRQYTEKDIEQIRLIYNLVKVRGFKIAAARKMLNENRDGSDQNARIIESLITVRDELKALKAQLDGLS